MVELLADVVLATTIAMADAENIRQQTIQQSTKG